MRLLRLKVKNFRTIGEPGVELSFDDNDAIFLIGPNNSGKSTVLHAYDYFVSASKKAELDCFHRRIEDREPEEQESHIDEQNPPVKPIEIEAWLKIEDDQDRQHPIVQNERWVLDGEIVRVRKIWKKVGDTAEKETFDRDKQEYDPGGSGGMPTLLQNACPTPVWIRGLSSPEEIMESLQSLVKEVILKRLSDSEDYKEKVQAAHTAINALRQTIVRSRYVEDLGRNLQSTIHEIFPDVIITLVHEGDEDFARILDKQTLVRIRDRNRPFVGLEYHGHGVRRQFILSSYRGLADPITAVQRGGRKKLEDLEVPELSTETPSSKSKMLLVEEPELFLHPGAMRAMRRLLYELADTSEFQVMCSTHAPVMIDLGRPHTSLVRINACDKCGAIVHQVDHNLFEEADREQIKMLTFFDPHVCEAFFADRIVLVEGNTEVVAVRTLLSRVVVLARERKVGYLTELECIESETGNGSSMVEGEDLEVERERLLRIIEEESRLIRDAESIHIVNCGSKSNIPFFQRVLRHFCIPYYVFHDLDSRYIISKETNSVRLTKSGEPYSNPAWSHNQSIWEEIEKAANSDVSARRYVFERDFESANYPNDDWQLDEGKPFAAYRRAMAWDMENGTVPVIRYLYSVLSRDEFDENFEPEWLEDRAMPKDVPVPNAS